MSDPQSKAISFQTFSKDLLSDPQTKPSPEEELLKIKHEVKKPNFDFFFFEIMYFSSKSKKTTTKKMLL